MFSIETYRKFHLTIHLISFTITLLNALFNKRYINKITEEYALKNGHSKSKMYIVRIFQHYTIWSQLFLIMALYFNKRELEMIAHILQTNLFILYTIIRFYDVSLLTYEENFPSIEFLQRATSWKFPLYEIYKKEYTIVFVWLIQNTQHLLAPLHYWVEHYFYKSVEHDNSLLFEINVLFMCYAIWNFYYWYVCGIPVYPIQIKIYKKGPLVTILFYTSCLLLLNISAIICDYFF
jgi:hypothetical protein